MSGMVQVLNQTSIWWFNNTKHITDNAIVSAPDPNVTIAKKCTVFPVEFVGNVFLASFVSLFLRLHSSKTSEFISIFLRLSEGRIYDLVPLKVNCTLICFVSFL